MDTDIAHARLASGMAVPLGAEYRRGIHDMLLMAVRGSVPRGVCQGPHFRYKCAFPRLSAELPFSVAQEFSRIFEALEKSGLTGRERDTNRVIRPRHVHDPGIQEEPRTRLALDMWREAHAEGRQQTLASLHRARAG